MDKSLIAKELYKIAKEIIAVNPGIEQGFTKIHEAYNNKEKAEGLAILRPILKQLMKNSGYEVGEVRIDNVYRRRVHMVVKPRKYADIKYMSLNIKWLGGDEVEVESYLKGMDREDIDNMMRMMGGMFLGPMMAGIPDMRKSGKGGADKVIPQVANETVEEWQKQTKNIKYQMTLTEKQAEIGAKYLAMQTKPVLLWSRDSLGYSAKLKLSFGNEQEVNDSWEKCMNFRLLGSKMDYVSNTMWDKFDKLKAMDRQLVEQVMKELPWLKDVK